jgi:hypothetical protein
MDSIVQNLKEVGVAFEQYDTPGLRREGDIHVAGEFKAVWFKVTETSCISTISEM